MHQGDGVACGVVFEEVLSVPLFEQQKQREY